MIDAWRQKREAIQPIKFYTEGRRLIAPGLPSPKNLRRGGEGAYSHSVKPPSRAYSCKQRQFNWGGGLPNVPMRTPGSLDGNVSLIGGGSPNIPMRTPCSLDGNVSLIGGTYPIFP